MTSSMQDQLRDYAVHVTSQSVSVDFDEIVSGDPRAQPVTQTVGARLEHPTEPIVSTRRRGWLVAAATAVAVLTLVGGVSLLPRVTGTGPPEAGAVPTTVEASTPTTVADSVAPRTVTDSLGNEWSRVPVDEAVFGGAEVSDVTAGGPGLVAVGGADGGAAVWTSVDGVSWSRVPRDDAVFGGAEMSDVTAGGPGLVAVGWDYEAGGAAWTSVDGLTWSRLPDELASLGDDGHPSVTVGGPGLVAVGQAGGDAAVWTSVDGLAWSRVPHDEEVFGGTDEAGMFDVTAGGPGLVAVGADWVEGGGLDMDDGVGDAVVWTSVDGLTWSRVPHDDAAFGGEGPWPAMTSVTAGGPGLVAVGYYGVWTSVDGLTWDYERSNWRGWSEVFSAGSGLVVIGSGARTSVDGITWSGVSISLPRSSGVVTHGAMTVGGPGLVAVVSTARGVEVWLVTPEN